MDTDTDYQQDQTAVSTRRPGAIAAGAILLVVGGTMLVDTSGLVDVPVGRLIGPFVLITLGALMIAEKGGVVYGRRGRMAEGGTSMRLRRRGGMTGGIWMIGVGAWMLVSQTHLFGLDYHNSWPLFIILSGVIMLIKGLR